MKQYIKKADIILLIVLIIVGLAGTVAVTLSKSNGSTVIIEQNGEMYGKYSLFEDQTITIKGSEDSEGSVGSVDSEGSKDSKKSEKSKGSEIFNIVEIKDGSVTMKESTCKNQVCVRHSKISASGESIICLPNRVVVRIEGKGGGYDAVTK